VAEPLRLAVLGTGSISIRGILPHCTMPDVQDRLRVTAVCDTVPGRAQAAAEKFGVPQAFDDYDALLREGEFDTVTIATPIGLHYEQGRAAVEAGKHVHFNKTKCRTHCAPAAKLPARDQCSLPKHQPPWRGSSSVNSVPQPTPSLETWTSPPCSSTRALTSANPRPSPP
jgi:hypothetical protein